MATTHPIEIALRSGSMSKYYARKINDVCRDLPEDISALTDEKREAIVKMAAACRSSKAVANALSITEQPSIDQVPEFSELFCETYYPVMEDGKRTVGFWSIKDSATLTPEDVHEWVRDVKHDKKTNKRMIVPVPFGTWWKNHKPDYELFGVASDRAMWHKKTIENEMSRKCVNTLYGKPPVATAPPKGYGDGKAAHMLLGLILKRVIHDADEDTAQRKRNGFVLDAGAHLLALREFRSFRCRKLFCFASTNGGQGTGKSLLQESIAALVPIDARCTVQTTELAGVNLLPLYQSSVCILTEAPSNATERYTAEDIKAFADSGWKTATEKYVAKRSVCDCSLKMMSSNHLSPLPVDSCVSRRVEFFVAKDIDDGGSDLRKLLDDVQSENKWSVDDLRKCIGWAFLEEAQMLLDSGCIPCAVARRKIDASHLLSVSDHHYFVLEGKNLLPSDYTSYRDFRTDMGITWSPDRYRFEILFELSKSKDQWHDGLIPDLFTKPLPPSDDSQLSREITEEEENENCKNETKENNTVKPVAEKKTSDVGYVGFDGALQYKARVVKFQLETKKLTFDEIYKMITSDQTLADNTAGVRNKTLDKKLVLPQIFPTAVFDKYSRRANLLGFTGLVHIDFDNIRENGNGLTPEQVRDNLATLPGFVIGAISSRGNGVWAIFNAGEKVTSFDRFDAARRALVSMAEEQIGMQADCEMKLPTHGRVIAHDADCHICEEALGGELPKPFLWKASTFSVAKVKLSVHRSERDMTIDERARIERFMEAVVEKACSSVQSATEGSRHGAAIRAVANIHLCASEHGMIPLVSWGRRVRDACMSTGLPKSEVADIMRYWSEKTGVHS